jgi:hypothetical protein
MLTRLQCGSSSIIPANQEAQVKGSLPKVGPRQKSTKTLSEKIKKTKKKKKERLRV